MNTTSIHTGAFKVVPLIDYHPVFIINIAFMYFYQIYIFNNFLLSEFLLNKKLLNTCLIIVDERDKYQP